MSDDMEQAGSGQQGGGGQPDDSTTSATDDSSVGLGNLPDEDEDEDSGLQPGSEPSQQDAHNPETDEDTASGGPAD